MIASGDLISILELSECTRMNIHKTFLTVIMKFLMVTFPTKIPKPQCQLQLTAININPAIVEKNCWDDSPSYKIHNNHGSKQA